MDGERQAGVTSGSAPKPLKLCKCLTSCQKDESCAKHEAPYKPGPAPKRLHGKCPMERTPVGEVIRCQGSKCRFIKKGCLYSRMKENHVRTYVVYCTVKAELQERA